MEFPDFPGCPEVFDLAEYITPFTQLITIVPRISEHDTNYQNFVNKTREYLYGDPWNVGKAPPPVCLCEKKGSVFCYSGITVR